MRLLVAARLNKPSWLEGRRMMASESSAGGGAAFPAPAAGRSFWVRQAQGGVTADLDFDARRAVGGDRRRCARSRCRLRIQQGAEQPKEIKAESVRTMYKL